MKKTLTIDTDHWQILPRVATEEMCERGSVHMTCSSNDVYESMLDAAPQPPEQEAEPPSTEGNSMPDIVQKEQRERIAELEIQLASFKSAVEHVTENGKTKRAFSASEGWAMVHKDRLTDLEVAEEWVADQIEKGNSFKELR